MFVCVAGKNNVAVDVLEYLVANSNGRYQLGVICNKTETGRNSWQKSLRFFANYYNVKEYSLDEIYHIQELIFISLEFDQIINPQRFRDARLYNIHFSLLPAYKGMYTSVIPILNGEKYVGVTFHKIDFGIDTGDIIKQKRIELKSSYTCRDLYMQYIEYGTKLVLECIEEVLAGKESAVPQGQDGATYYSKKYIDYSNIQIDLKQTASTIERQIRAFSFREYQMPKVYGREIISAKITKDKSKKKPGTLLFSNENGMIIATIDYNIILYFDRFSELMEACKEGNYGLVKEICIVTEHINAVDKEGQTPLYVAMANNHFEIVNFLIMNGGNIEDIDNDELQKWYKEIGLNAEE